MNITLKAESESGFVKIFIDDRQVLSEPGTMTELLNDNHPHTLTWFVQGLPGQSYKIEITDPSAEAWKVSGKLKNTGKVTGQHNI